MTMQIAKEHSESLLTTFQELKAVPTYAYTHSKAVTVLSS